MSNAQRVARVQALEVAQGGSVQLDVQPGDALGRTAARSPSRRRCASACTACQKASTPTPVTDGERVIVSFASSPDAGPVADLRHEHTLNPAMGLRAIVGDSDD